MLCQFSLKTLQRSFCSSQTRSLKIFAPEEPMENVTLPEGKNKYRLPLVPKIPSEWLHFMGKLPRGTKEAHRMMGEERVHNQLILGQYGIVAVHGGLLKFSHFDFMRSKVGRFLEPKTSFAFYRVDAPFKPITKHGQGKKLGGGKGSVDTYGTPIRAGRVIMEVGGTVYWEEVKPWLTRVADRLPFEAIAVNQNILDRLNAEEARLEAANENPYSFEWLVRNNMLDCQSHLSPYDTKWFGKFMYRDRAYHNKKWNLTRQSVYKHKSGNAG